MTLRVTLDTNTINDRDQIETACAGFDVELAYTTVTGRETEGTRWARNEGTVLETGVWGESRWNQFVWGGVVPESAVLGEWRLGEAVLGSEEGGKLMEEILRVIGGGSFPAIGRRDEMTAGQRRQLRDAMILEAHVRETRDVFVTEDARGFIRDGRRERLEALCRTRILTVDEFCATVATMCAS